MVVESMRQQLRQRRPRWRVPAAPHAFMGPPLEVPSLVPGWLMPSWLVTPEADSPRDAVRRRRLEQLRCMLGAARRAPPLELPAAADDPPMLADDGSGAAHGTLDVAHTASNAVPFHAGGGGSLPTALGAPSSAAGGAASSRVEQARQVLPWLYAAEGRLDCAAMESLASQLALSGLQLLDVSRYVAAAGGAGGHWHGAWGGHIRWAGPPGLPSPVMAAAAALRRMELRRGGALAAVPELEGKVVSGQVEEVLPALVLLVCLCEAVDVAAASSCLQAGQSPLHASLLRCEPCFTSGSPPSPTHPPTHPGCAGLPAAAPPGGRRGAGAVPARLPGRQREGGGGGGGPRRGRLTPGGHPARLAGGAGSGGRWLAAPRHAGLALRRRPRRGRGGGR
jgi:hypothetical protein